MVNLSKNVSKFVNFYFKNCIKEVSALWVLLFLLFLFASQDNYSYL